MEDANDDSSSGTNGAQSGPFLLIRLTPSPIGMKDLFHFAGYDWHRIMARLLELRHAMLDAQGRPSADGAIKKTGLPYLFALGQLLPYDLVLLHGPLLGHCPATDRGSSNTGGKRTPSVKYDSLVSEYAVVAMVIVPYLQHNEQIQLVKLLVDTLQSIPTMTLSRRLRDANFEQDSLESLTELCRLVKTDARSRLSRNAPDICYALWHAYTEHTERFRDLGASYMTQYCTQQTARMFERACFLIGRKIAAQQEAAGPAGLMNEDELKKANVLLMASGKEGQSELERHESAIFIDHTHGKINPRSKFGDLRDQAATLSAGYLEEILRRPEPSNGGSRKGAGGGGSGDYASETGDTKSSADPSLGWQTHMDTEFVNAFTSWEAMDHLRSTKYHTSSTSPWSMTSGLIAFARLSVHPLATIEQKEALMRHLAEAGIPETELIECLAATEEKTPQYWLDRAGCISPSAVVQDEEPIGNMKHIASFFTRLRDLVSTRIARNNNNEENVLTHDNPHIPTKLEIDDPYVFPFDLWWNAAPSVDQWIKEEGRSLPTDFVTWASGASVSPAQWLSRYTEQDWHRLGLTGEQLRALGFGSGVRIFENRILKEAWDSRRAEFLFGLPKR